MLLAALPAPTASLMAVSTVELTIRMVVGLAVVGVLLFLLNRMTRRVLDGRSRLRPTISIRHQQRLDRHASVTLLQAGDRNLLIGTAGQSIVLLAEGDDLAVDEPLRPGSSTGTRPGSTSGSGSGSGPKAGSGAKQGSGSSIDVRTRNPIRALQNKTVRRG